MYLCIYLCMNVCVCGCVETHCSSYTKTSLLYFPSVCNQHAVDPESGPISSAVGRYHTGPGRPSGGH